MSDPKDDYSDAALAALANAPGVTRIEQVRVILQRFQAMKIDGVLVDGFSASAYVEVWKRLSPPNQVKLDGMPIVKAVETVFKVIQKTGSR